MQRANLFSLEIPRRDGPGNEPPGYAAHEVRVGPLIGSKLLGATIYELPSGQSNCPYHYEYGNEEWLIVIAGRPSLRHPVGEDELVAGDIVCFPEGPAGAHKLTNRTDETVRFAILSTKQSPAVAVYPDSDKLAIWRLGDHRDNLITRRAAAVDYWEGET
ncbi:MAG: cupin domain-containing protein [Actinobacteria bacterium]|nr:cupin domain-containing protein [Actinomycetota bacterium]